MTYKIEIDRDGCIACAACYTIDPAHFESDAEAKSRVMDGISNGKSTGSFDDTKKTDADAAAGSCPVCVIVIARALKLLTAQTPLLLGEFCHE